MTVKRSPLHSAHERLGARFTDFGGWEMPLQYEGTLSEHRAVRSSSGIFDVSHLGRFELAGPRSRDLVSSLLCNDPGRIAPGRAQYTMMLAPDGGVLDDIIVWWLEEERFILLPNGGNHESVIRAFADAAGPGVAVTDMQGTTVLLAIQGPEAPAVIEAVLGAMPGRFRISEGIGAGEAVVAAGTGYTGEDGAEILAPSAIGEELLDRFIATGVVACGLGARDTLRLEMGYPLWGQDLDETTTPLEAGLQWVVEWTHDFTGRDALIAQRDTGVSKRLVAFRLAGRSVPRHGFPIRCGESNGTVASGNFSPALEAGIGMGYLSPPAPETATSLEVEIRGTWHEAAIVDPPFVRS